jgi:hypothetical protein
MNSPFAKNIEEIAGLLGQAVVGYSKVIEKNIKNLKRF